MAKADHFTVTVSRINEGMHDDPLFRDEWI
jgi:hypothetical protein